jgi:hypothetical protein
VEVAHPEVRPKFLETHVEQSWGVGGVDERQHPPLAQSGNQRGDGEHDTGSRGDVVDDRQPGSLGDSAEDLFVQAGRPVGRQRHRGHDNSRPGPRAGALGRNPDGPVGLRRDEQLVAMGQADRGQNRADPGGHIGHEDDALGISAEERGGVDVGGLQQVAQVAKERIGVAVGQPPEAVLVLQHRQRHGTESTMVEVCKPGVERPLSAHRGPVWPPEGVDEGPLLAGRRVGRTGHGIPPGLMRRVGPGHPG